MTIHFSLKCMTACVTYLNRAGLWRQSNEYSTGAERVKLSHDRKWNIGSLPPVNHKGYIWVTQKLSKNKEEKSKSLSTSHLIKTLYIENMMKNKRHKRYLSNNHPAVFCLYFEIELKFGVVTEKSLTLCISE